MKLFKLLLVFLFVLTTSCEEKKQKVQTDNKKEIVKVKHYICANKCENSGSDVEGICPTCNTPYLHNQAFHNDEFLKNGPLNVPKTNLGNTTNPTQNTAPSPAQNALGIFHYTCTNGCPGGSGTAENCVACGTLLAHNTAYHN
ncbi:MAG: hypothetical protein HKP59_05255 [Lutibacter sp.]|uniref:hypothetical protein n=1 Tax=Lutibacter sp. TaxID=1925666 RepID=UPI001855068A|nr:hypothetical protein [Lutibacter sp.]MBT8317011.1 hypothetical protein [Lutibacter sp.]NNJ57871.1 hypothetical protein [Lutibacter sp.]